MIEESAELDELRQLSRYAKDIASYVRRRHLTIALSDPERRRAYEASDGIRTSDEVRQVSGVTKSARSILNWWGEWIDAGLAERTRSGTARALYSTSFVDIDD